MDVKQNFAVLAEMSAGQNNVATRVFAGFAVTETGLIPAIKTWEGTIIVAVDGDYSFTAKGIAGQQEWKMPAIEFFEWEDIIGSMAPTVTVLYK